MIYGYTRVSTRKQVDGYGLEAQRQEILSKYPNAYIFEEQYTGSKMERPIFTKLINQLKENDVLVVAKLDRFARTTIEGIKVVEELFKRKISIHILNVGLLEDTPMGRFFLTTMLAVAELERNMIIERTQSGKELARQNPNFKDGRPPKYTQEELYNALLLLQTHSYSQVIKATGISKSTLIRAKQSHI